jgi:hypothetical protein
MFRRLFTPLAKPVVQRYMFIRQATPYVHTADWRLYTYQIKGSFHRSLFEQKYAAELLGNDDTRRAVDVALADYMSKHEITERHVVITVPTIITANFTIEENSNPATLILRISKNSLR